MQGKRLATLWVVVIGVELLVEVVVLWEGYGGDQGSECFVGKMERSENQYCRLVGTRWATVVCLEVLAQ